MSLDNLKTKLSGIAVPSAPPAAGTDTSAVASGPRIAEILHAARGFDLDVTVPPDRVIEAARIMDVATFMLEAITGVDWIAEQQFEVVYDYTSVTSGERVTVRARIPRAAPEIPSITSLHPGANWHEREAHDFFGIVFTGHPDLSTLLLPEDADFHPLLKNFGT